jgi:hypothetical protein
MFDQIRKLMAEEVGTLSGQVEADETYVGGRRKGKRGRGAAGKTIVQGMVEKKLQSYVDSYTFRWNHRDDEMPMFVSLLNRIPFASAGKPC